MASYDRLIFSVEGFKQEMNRLIDESLDEAVNEIQRNEWFRGTAPEYMVMEGYDSYVEISANHLKAWIVEYGQGEAAETERNPYWEDYVSKSGLTNEDRKNGTVLKRGAKAYKSADFQHNKIRHHDHGSTPKSDPVSDGLQKALAVEAEPFLEELMRRAWQAFVIAFNTRMESFSLAGCIFTVTEHV